MQSTPERTKRKYTPREKWETLCEWCESPYLTSVTFARFCGTKCKDRARYHASRDKRLAAVQEYRERNRDLINARQRDARTADPTKVAARNREQYLKNRDRRVEQAVEYQKAHPEVVALTRNRRKAAKAFKVSQRDHRRLLHRHDNKCAYCLVPLGPWGRASGTSLQWDHVMPLSRGGTDGVGNLAPSCRDCNTRKSSRLLIEWIASKN